MCYKRVTYVLHLVTYAHMGNIFNVAEKFWWCGSYSTLLKEVS